MNKVQTPQPTYALQLINNGMGFGGLSAIANLAKSAIARTIIFLLRGEGG